MSFPLEQLDLHLQILLRGHWVEMAAFATVIEDIYIDTYVDEYGGRLVWDYNRLLAQSLTITHGRADETSDAQPSGLSFRLKNNDGQLTPDDPRSQWWPDVANGAQVRVLVGTTVVFWGEIASILPVWPSGDLTSQIAYVDITANGILRRLGQGQKVLRSPIQRVVVQNAAHISDYWSMEDGSNSTTFGSDLGSSVMSFTGMSLSSDSELLGSESLPSISQDGSWAAAVRGPSGTWIMDWYLHIPEAFSDNGSSIVTEIYTTGTHSTWRIVFGFIDGDSYVWVRSFDSSGATLTDDLLPDPQRLFGGWVHIRLRVVSGASWGIDWTRAGEAVFEGIGDVLTGTTGQPYFVRTTVTKAPSKGVAFGHVSFHNDSLPSTWLEGADTGWAGDSAATRMSRLAAEEGAFLNIYSGTVSTSTALLGPQKSATFLDLMREAAAADGGILCETRTRLGLQYRTLKSRYNQPVAMTFDASKAQIDNPFAPTNDDQTIRNKITVQRANGGTVTVVDQRSAAAAPAGDGQYDESVTLSLDTDAQLPDQAGWRRHLGTWSSKTRDLPSGQRLRYPQVTVDLAKASPDVGTYWGGVPFEWGGAPAVWGSSVTITDLWLARRVGHRINVINLPAQHPVEGPVDLVIQGWSETLSPFGWVVTLNCSPAGRYTVGKWGDLYCSGNRSALAVPIDSTQTTFDVRTTGSPVWTTSPVGVQIRVGRSELMTVTGIGAASSGVQTFTVTRNVNGFARAHAAGESVNLYPIPVLGL